MAFFAKYFSIRTRFMSVLLALASLASLAIIIVGYQKGTAIERDSITRHLNTLKTAKASQIELYFRNLRNTVQIMGENEMVYASIKQFGDAMDLLDKQLVDTTLSTEVLDGVYRTFAANLASNLDVQIDEINYVPRRSSAIYLQRQYIANNDAPDGQRDLLTDDGSGSVYNEVHKNYHPYYRDVLNTLGLYDIMLVDYRTGDVVYTTEKEVDFGASMNDGAYAQSSLGKMIRELQDNLDLGTAQIADYSFYRPSEGNPTAFIGVNVRQGSNTIGALIFQIPVEQINAIMTSEGKWREAGLGETGETYLIGEDFLMRSISRFYIEDDSTYTQQLLAQGTPQRRVEAMQRMNTTILYHRIRTDAVEQALDGETGFMALEDDRGVPILSSFRPIDIEGLNWALMVEINQAEAFENLSSFTRTMLSSWAIVIAVLTFIAMAIARQFVKPMEYIIQGVRRMREPGSDYKLTLDSADSYGELARNVNSMAEVVRNQEVALTTANSEREKTLQQFLPDSIVLRMQQGITDFTEHLTNVTLIVINLHDINEEEMTYDFSQPKPEPSVAQQVDRVKSLTEAVNEIDQLAKHHGIEKIKSIGDNYFAACGLFTTRMDHSKRSVDFAGAVQNMLRTSGKDVEHPFNATISVHSGDVVAGTIGSTKINFDLWGTTVKRIFQISSVMSQSDTYVTQDVYERVQQLYKFELYTEASDSFPAIWTPKK